MNRKFGTSKILLVNKILLCSLIFYCGSLKAQVSGTDVFLQGNYVEIGIATNGAFGSGGSAPVGFHPRPGTAATNLGFVSDPDKDGWAIGTPDYFGDFFLPGTPQEGWAISVAGTTSEAYRRVSASSMTGGLTGSNTSYVDSTYIKKAVWTGSIGSLEITQTTTVKPNDLYFIISVKLKNSGATDLSNVFYMRTVDPDNDRTLPGGGSATRNTVVEKLPNPENKVLIQATGNVYTAAYLGLGAKDPRAKSFSQNAGLFPVSNLSDIFNETGTAASYRYDTTTYTVDAAIGLIYNIGTIAAGDSTSVAYTYVLGPTFVDSAFASVGAPLPLNFTSFEAKSANCAALLKWTYNTDEKISNFIIERSIDGHRFEAIAQLPENSTNFRDLHPATQQSFYRIKASTNYGKTYYTSTQSVSLNKDCFNDNSVKITPNPAQDEIKVSVSSGKVLLTYEIATIAGKTIISGVNSNGDMEINIDIRSISDGYYILKTNVNDILRSTPFIIKH